MQQSFKNPPFENWIFKQSSAHTTSSKILLYSNKEKNCIFTRKYIFLKSK